MSAAGSPAVSAPPASAAAVGPAAPPASPAASAAPSPVGPRGRPIPLQKRGGLREFSVVFTDRAVNHMSPTFQDVMKDLHAILTEAYNCKRAVIIPGSGTFAMESVARQLMPALAGGEKVMVIRNGFFSYRWTDIFTQTGLATGHIVVPAVPVDGESRESPAFRPPLLDEVLAQIREHKPAVLLAAHVETSTGILLPDEYIQAVSRAVHEHGGHLVLDGIAAGLKWADMAELGIDFYISAPQKAWSAPAAVGLVMLSERGYAKVADTTSDSMALNLKRWCEVMEAYISDAAPGFAYYTTMPTDALQRFRDAARETRDLGFAEGREMFERQGEQVCALLEKFGLKIVAQKEFRAPGVVVAYVPSSVANPVLEFKKAGLQVAAGVPFKLGEQDPERGTFRIGLFGLDKLYDGQATLDHLERAMARVWPSRAKL